MEKFYNIAGLIVKMSTFGRTEAQAEAYRIDPCDQYDITISTDELKEQGVDMAELWPASNEDGREYLGTGTLFYRYLLKFNGLGLHSSCVVVDDRAYLFSAYSGTGKSTHTNLWLKQFGDRAYILNDDKPALRLENGVWYAYGTPWSGKHDISVNVGVPVAGIACIERGITNHIERFSGVEAIQAVLKQLSRPRWMEYRVKLLELMDSLISNVPVWKLKCNMDPSAVIVSYEAMSGKKINEENLNEN